jgi:hypothetical protein
MGLIFGDGYYYSRVLVHWGLRTTTYHMSIERSFTTISLPSSCDWGERAAARLWLAPVFVIAAKWSNELLVKLLLLMFFELLCMIINWLMNFFVINTWQLTGGILLWHVLIDCNSNYFNYHQILSSLVKFIKLCQFCVFSCTILFPWHIQPWVVNLVSYHITLYTWVHLSLQK